MRVGSEFTTEGSFNKRATPLLLYYFSYFISFVSYLLDIFVGILARRGTPYMSRLGTQICPNELIFHGQGQAHR